MTRCLQQVRVIIIPSSSSDPPEQHAWSPVRLEAAAAVVDDHVAMMAEDPNTRNEVPTGAGIQCRWTRTATQHHRQRHDGYDDDDDGRPHHSSSSSSSSEGKKSSPAIMGQGSLKGVMGKWSLKGSWVSGA